MNKKTIMATIYPLQTIASIYLIVLLNFDSKKLTQVIFNDAPWSSVTVKLYFSKKFLLISHNKTLQLTAKQKNKFKNKRFWL